MIIPGGLSNAYSEIPEAVKISVGNKSKNYLASSDYKNIVKTDFLERKAPLLIGPGLGEHIKTTELTSRLLKYIKSNGNSCVLDGSGFEPLYHKNITIKDLPENSILTPHYGEFKKIFPEISLSNDNPIELCRSIADKLNGRVLVLKGPSTVVVTQSKQFYIINNSNSLLATAGSGDVLAGIILGLLSCGYNIDNASILGVYIHSSCSMIQYDMTSKKSMSASDIIEKIPIAFNELS